ncbi:MAG: hypothetical protein QOF02_328 [Blastocatellia bacterium]|jgi:hypothetical protein|nr:hypothetical protein [Blastocatellia bacterium]
MNKKATTRLFKFLSGALALCMLVLALWPARVNACACCTEPGAWYERTDPISSYELSEISRLRFDAMAHTFTEAGEGSTTGLSNPADEYSISLSKRARRWELKFRDKQGRTGVLTFSVPASMVNFGADINDGQQSSGGGPSLYKEWRLTGAVTGTGIFRSSAPQTKFRLILQGRGNNCTDADTFDNWKLQIFGPRASYSFYGKLADPAPAKS